MSPPGFQGIISLVGSFIGAKVFRQIEDGPEFERKGFTPGSDGILPAD